MSARLGAMRRMLAPVLTLSAAIVACVALTVGAVVLGVAIAAAMLGGLSVWLPARHGRRHAAETETFYRETLDGLGGRVCRYRVDDLSVVYCNDEWAAAFDGSAAELVGRSLEDLLSLDERQALHEQIPIALESRVLTGTVAKRRGPDGSTVVETWIDRVLDAAPGTEILSIGRDITDLYRAESANRFLAENTTDVLMRLDADRRVRFVTPAVATMLEITPDDVIGAPVQVLIHPDHHDTLAHTFDLAIDTGWAQSAEVVAAAMAPEVTVWCDLTVSTVLSEEGEVEFHVGLRDITEVREAERQFRSLAEGTPVPVFTMTVDDGVDYANPAMHRWCGAPNDDVGGGTAGHRWLDYLPADERRRLNHLVQQVVTDAAEHHLEHHVMVPSLGPRWVATTLRPIDGGRRVIGTVVDLTEQRFREEQLAHEATHDALTGLSNRVHLHDRLDQSLRRMGRTGDPPAVLFLDLDRFKPVNDRYGHAAGDQVLTTIAQRIVHSVRSGDTAARLGGDEFVVLAEPPADAAGIEALAQRLVDHLASDIELRDGTVVSVGVSIGIATGEIGEDADELLARADAAVYAAKKSGRGRAQRYDAESAALRG